MFDCACGSEEFQEKMHREFYAKIHLKSGYHNNKNTRRTSKMILKITVLIKKLKNKINWEIEIIKVEF